MTSPSAMIHGRVPVNQSSEPLQPIRLGVQYELQGDTDDDDNERHSQRANDQFTEQW